MTRHVLTTDDGTVLERPEAPASDAPIDEKIAYQRAVAEFNDRVAETANRAFERAFLRVIRKS